MHIREWLQLIVTFLTPVSLIAGLLFYFGYARTVALYRAFGVSPSLLDLSWRDYVVRSTAGLYLPLGLLILILIALLWSHEACTILLRQGAESSASLLAMLLLTGGVVAFLFAFRATFVYYDPRSVRAPIWLAIGVISLSYARYVWEKRRPTAARQTISWTRGTNVMLVVILIGLCVLWVFTVRAEEYGRLTAKALFKASPNVEVYSRHRLPMPSRLVAEDTLPVNSSSYRYRYRGLKLLTESGNRVFVFPVQWDPQRWRTVMLEESEALQFQFFP